MKHLFRRNTRRFRFKRSCDMGENRGQRGGGSESKSDMEMKGWLHKWTNYLKGYQKRWFVLSNGLLSYYRSQAEMAHTCRGAISLNGATINTEESLNFVISNGATQTFHLRASSEVERQKWVTTLELAKARSQRSLESDEDDDLVPAQSDKSELQAVIRLLSSKLEDLSTCNDLIVKHGTNLQRSLSELESLNTVPASVSSSNSSSSGESSGSTVTYKTVSERATLFRITCNAMIKACSDYLDLAQAQGKRWQRILQHEREQRLRLEEMVEQIATQHSHLEEAAKEHTEHHPQMGNASLYSDDDDEAEFFDAVDDVGSEFVVRMTHRRSDVFDSDIEIREYDPSESTIDEKPENRKRNSIAKSGEAPLVPVKRAGARKRRTRIPDRPTYSLNLWSIMKNCIGKELTKIPMPVNFSEPLSMLQRLTEDYEYSDLLNIAATCTDPYEQMIYVAAFTVSSYASTSYRNAKPFNPLLGETYECDRMDDLGWRCISEQVSHHPPMLAQHCEGGSWTSWQEFTMSSKFRGKYLSVIPLGISHLHFHDSGNHYTWRKVTTTVHNIIVGKLWVDQHGEMDIVNHSSNVKCHLKFDAYSYFSRGTPRKVTGYITDNKQDMRWVVSGTWDDKIEAAKVINSSSSDKGRTTVDTGPRKLLWKAKALPRGAEKYYNFAELTSQLNEEEDDVAPTDARLRPDQRLMEKGEWDQANAEKLRLEEKQRGVRREREKLHEQMLQEGKTPPEYEPLWFKKQTCKYTQKETYEFTGEYWDCKEKQEWSRCPDIY